MGSHRYSHDHHQAYKRLVSVKVQKRGFLYLWDPIGTAMAIIRLTKDWYQLRYKKGGCCTYGIPWFTLSLHMQRQCKSWDPIGTATPFFVPKLIPIFFKPGDGHEGRNM